MVNYREDEEDEESSLEEDDFEQEDTFSLPSFSNSIRQQLETVGHYYPHKTSRPLGNDIRPLTNTRIPPSSSVTDLNRGLKKSQSVTSLKEVENQNSQLRSENFHLKLRIYMLEKEREKMLGNHPPTQSTALSTVPSSSGLGSSVTSTPSGKSNNDTHEFEESLASELIKKDSLIKKLQEELHEKMILLKNMRRQNDAFMKLKELELERIITERDQLQQQLDLVNSKKENMGQAINRQLKKIEKLLETTALYVQEIQ